MGALKAHTQIREYEAGIGNDVLCVFDGQCTSSDGIKTVGAISPSGLDAEAVAFLARTEIASRLRSQQPLQLCLLVGGMVRCNNSAVLSSHFRGFKDASSSSFPERVQKQVSAGSAVYVARKGSDRNEDTEPKYGESQPSDLEISSSIGGKQTLVNPFLAPKLFWLDQYGSLQSLRYGAHGYGSNFALSVLDQRYRKEMSRQEAVNLIRDCFEQLRQRYVINSPKPPRIKCVDAYGVTEIKGCS